MTALPIVSRELRILARRPSTYWVRFAIALLAAVLGGYMLIFAARLNFGAMAKQMLFSIISSVIGMYALFVGIRNTADCLSSEKREGTLGLLFLTDLNGYDVVLGKLCSAAINSLYGMMAAFPILGIALIGGGITGSEFVRGSLAIVNVIFFAHAAGLAISAYSLNGRRAVGAGVAIGFILLWGLPILTGLLAYGGWPQTGQWLAQLSPLNALHMALTSTPVSATSIVFGGGLPGVVRVSFWVSLAVSHLLAWIFIIIASSHTPRSWQNVDIKLNWRARMQYAWYGSPESRTAFQRKLVGINPFFWLASRTRFDPHLTMGILLAVAGAILWLFLKLGMELVPFSIALMVMLHIIVRVGIASSASRHFAEQRKNGALEFLLACTPLDTKDLVRGQWLALRRVFLVPLILVLASDLGLFTAVWCTHWKTKTFLEADELLPYSLFVIATVVMLAADSIALGWAGMWTGISSSKANRASGIASARIMIYPTACSLIIWGVISELSEHTNGYVLLGLWFFIGLGCDLFWILYSRSAIYRKFRTLAATPYEEQSGVMAALGRAFGQLAKSRARANEIPPMIAK